VKSKENDNLICLNCGSLMQDTGQSGEIDKNMKLFRCANCKQKTWSYRPGENGMPVDVSFVG
jgi:DNA-directed RNA polymerase subunit RPC12/RpoP